MNTKINILHLEDSHNDSELIHSIIENGEINCNYYLADNENDYLNILKTENINIILSDYSMPGYKGSEALKFARQNYSLTPFIFVSGTIGEDTAINAMLNGATDYVLKNKLDRLVPAIKRALHERELEISHTQAENELRESEERFKAIFNDAPMGIALIDSLTGKIITVNPSFASISGQTIEEMINIDWISIVYLDDIQLVLNKMAQLAAGEINAFHLEKRNVHSDGSIVWINMTISKILHDKKSTPRHVCMIEDISEQRQAEQELIIANIELAFQNNEKERRAAELVVANEELAFQNEEKEKRAAELIIANKELALQNRKKEKRAAELIIANKELLFQNNEKEKRATELIIAKERAEERDRLKLAFLANMSHEIRTPMNGILGFADLLKEPNLTGEMQQEYILIIEKSGARMLNIINDIVSISKIESGLMEVNIQESNVNKQTEFIYTFFKPQVEEKGIRFLIKNTLTEKELFIKSDSEKIYSILTNLVKNAIKYTKKGEIELGYSLKTENKTAMLEFYVKDTGIGIPKDRQKAIFERFIQADICDIMALQGAGLGLSIAKAYVEMLGGKIWVESEEGKGSIFYFTLPYRTELQEKTIDRNDDWSKKADGMVNPNVSGLKILIAEDDETSKKFMSAIVIKHCKEVLKASTGIKAVDICRNNPDIDLILMDIQMPELNGYEATRQIRKFNKDVVIIAQTAFGLSGDEEKAIESGCNDYISKPFNKAKLLAIIQKYIKK